MAPQNGTKREKAAAALAAGLSNRQAARKLNIPVRTLARWRSEDPAFRVRVAELRTALLEGAAGALVARGRKAARALADLLASADEKVRLSASVKVLDMAARLSEVIELRGRLDELEKLVRGSAHGQPEPPHREAAPGGT
jgi:hypothetical protein